MENLDIEEIQDTMFSIYKKNLNFFNKNVNYLYKKILDFEGTNKYKYNLEFIDNHFELIDDHNKYTYNCDPYYDAEYRFKNLSDKSSFILIKIDSNYEEKRVWDSKINPVKIINEYIKIIEKKNININGKFVFLGAILGLHISEIIKKSEFKTFLIVEDNLEIFRLSMFLNDYEDLSKSKEIYFAITKENKYPIIKEFFNSHLEFNNKINFELASEREIYLIEEMSNIFLQENEFNYPFSEYLTSYFRGIQYIKENHKLLRLNKKYSILKSYKILFLGGGLSLENEISFLVKNKNNFLIVCVAATLKILEQNNIIPDLIITSDSGRIIKNQFLVDEKYYKESIIFASNKTHNDVIDLLPKENVFLFNDSLEIFDKTGINIGVNVGNIGYSILLKLGVDTIYLLGFDACVDTEKGRSHSSNNEKKEFKKFDVMRDEKINSEIHIIKVKGNFEKFVYTTSHFIGMIKSFEEIKNIFNVKAFNLSNGAYLSGIKPLKSHDVKISIPYDKNIEKDIIKKNFKKISKKSFNLSEKKFLDKERRLIEKLKELNEDDLYNNFLFLYKENSTSLILQILNKYFRLVLPFYYYSKNINIEKSTKIFNNNFFDIVDYINETL